MPNSSTARITLFSTGFAAKACCSWSNSGPPPPARRRGTPPSAHEHHGLRHARPALAIPSSAPDLRVGACHAGGSTSTRSAPAPTRPSGRKSTRVAGNPPATSAAFTACARASDARRAIETSFAGPLTCASTVMRPAGSAASDRPNAPSAATCAASSSVPTSAILTPPSGVATNSRRQGGGGSRRGGCQRRPLGRQPRRGRGRGRGFRAAAGPSPPAEAAHPARAPRCRNRHRQTANTSRRR